MKNYKKMVSILTASFALVLIVLAVRFLTQKSSDNEETVQESKTVVDLKDYIDLGKGLKLTDLSEVVGNFPEDGSDEFVESMLSATFVNESEKTIQYASVQVMIGEEKFTFVFSTVPAGERICVYEKDKKSADQINGDISAEAEYVAYFQDILSLFEEQLKVIVGENTITVKNISGETIDKEISIFYKTVSGGMYMGGITYRLRIPAGLKPGEEYSGSAGHVSEKLTKVMFITYGD